MVVTGIHQRLLLGHLRLVFFLRHPDRPDTAAVEELAHDGLVTGQQQFAGPKHDQVLRNSMPMLSGMVRAMLMLCVTIISVRPSGR